VEGFAEALAVLSDQRLSNDPTNGLGLHPDITFARPAVSQTSRYEPCSYVTPRSTTAFVAQWRPLCLSG